MATILKVDEWQSASKRWYVADVHTWTGWRECADVLGADSLEGFKELLTFKYKAIIVGLIGEKGLMFYWPSTDYKNAHQFKLDVNRLARNKKYMVG